MSEWAPKVETIQFESTGRHVDIIRNPNIVDLIATGAFNDDEDTSQAGAVRAREIIRAMLVRPRLVDDPSEVCFDEGSEAVQFSHLMESEVAELIAAYQQGAADAERFRTDADRAGGSDDGEGMGDAPKRGTRRKAG